MPSLFLTATDGPGGIARTSARGRRSCLRPRDRARRGFHRRRARDRARGVLVEASYPRPPVPDLPGAAADWARNSIDDLYPRRSSLRASRRRSGRPEGVLRRVTFDLTGLPPAPGEIGGVPRRPRPGCLREGGGPPPRIARGTASGGGGTGSTSSASPAESNGYERDGAKAKAVEVSRRRGARVQRGQASRTGSSSSSSRATRSRTAASTGPSRPATTAWVLGR